MKKLLSSWKHLTLKGPNYITKAKYIPFYQVIVSQLTSKLKYNVYIDGFPQVHWFGVEGEFNCLIMNILGPNLGQLFDFCGKNFSSKTICNIAHQILLRLESLHGKQFVHRDMKPENICIGQGKKDKVVYLIDFGLAKRYLCPKTGDHIEYRPEKGVVGTLKYLSLNTHLGAEHGRRDDLEALCFIIIYFFNGGELAWDLPKP